MDIMENPHEGDIAEILMTGLKHRYGTQEENRLFPLLYLRRHLLGEKTGSMTDFMLKELNLSEKCRYKETALSQGMVVQNFYDNLAFIGTLHHEIRDLETIKKKLNRTARFRARKYRSLEEYDIFYRYFLVEELEKAFHLSFSPPKIFPDILYETEEMPYRRCLEEKLIAHIHAVKMESSHISFVSEEQVENYLSKNLYILEEGLTLTGKQVVVDGGRIDILARDRQGVTVIIEIKVEEDKDILWQCTHYPEQIKKLEKTDRVRMMTFCPSYRPQILHHLKELSHVEIFTYKAFSELGRLKHLDAVRVIS